MTRPTLADERPLGRNRPQPLGLIPRRKPHLSGRHVARPRPGGAHLLLQPREHRGHVCPLLGHRPKCRRGWLRSGKQRVGLRDRTAPSGANVPGRRVGLDQRGRARARQSFRSSVSTLEHLTVHGVRQLGTCAEVLDDDRQPDIGRDLGLPRHGSALLPEWNRRGGCCDGSPEACGGGVSLLERDHPAARMPRE